MVFYCYGLGVREKEKDVGIVLHSCLVSEREEFYVLSVMNLRAYV